MQTSSRSQMPFLATDAGHLFLGAVIGLVVAGYVTVSLGLEDPKWTFAFILGLVTPFLAILSKDVKRFFVGILILSVPFLMFQKMLVMREGNHVTFGIGIGIMDFPLIVLVAWWIIRLMTIPEERARLTLFSGFNRIVFIYVGVSFLSVLMASDRMLSMFEVVKIIKAVLLFLWVSHSIRSDKEHRYFLFFLLLGVIVENTIVIFQSFGIGVGTELFSGIKGIHEFVFHDKTYLRPGGTLSHANLLSLYTGMTIPLAFSLILKERLSPWLRAYCWLAFFSGVAALILCFSRSGWLNISVSTITILALNYQNVESKKRVIRTSMLFSLVLIAILAYYHEAIIDRLFYSDPKLMTMRWDKNWEALKMFLHNPFLGVGLNNYMHALPDYLETRYLRPVHCVYLLMAAETGLIGLVAFLAIGFSWLQTAIGLIRDQLAFRSSVAIGLTGVMLGVLADELFSFALKLDTAFYQFWLLAGWLVALERSGKGELASGR